MRLEAPPKTETHSLETLWQLVLVDLSMQMTQATFDLWLRDSYLLPGPSTDTFWVIVLRNEYAWAWVTGRLAGIVERTVWRTRKNLIQLCFIPGTMQSDLKILYAVLKT